MGVGCVKHRFGRGPRWTREVDMRQDGGGASQDPEHRVLEQRLNNYIARPESTDRQID